MYCLIFAAIYCALVLNVMLSMYLLVVIIALILRCAYLSFCFGFNFGLQGISKGVVAEKIFTSMAERGRQADFVLCVGDDRSDEHMFEIIGNAVSSGILSSNTSVFACTVGQKPSKAKYYLDDTTEVINMLDALADASDPSPSPELEASSP